MVGASRGEDHILPGEIGNLSIEPEIRKRDGLGTEFHESLDPRQVTNPGIFQILSRAYHL